MTYRPTTLQPKLDQTDLQILKLLMENARISYAELGRQVGLSLPAASERVRRMEDAGLIRGYQANINLKALGYTITVFIELTIPPDRYAIVKQKIAAIPEIIEAHHVAGDLSMMLKLHLSEMEALEPILAQLTPPGRSKSIVVLSTTVVKNGSDFLDTLA